MKTTKYIITVTKNGNDYPINLSALNEKDALDKLEKSFYKYDSVISVKTKEESRANFIKISGGGGSLLLSNNGGRTTKRAYIG